jgi:hypothetical protein
MIMHRRELKVSWSKAHPAEDWLVVESWLKAGVPYVSVDAETVHHYPSELGDCSLVSFPPPEVLASTRTRLDVQDVMSAYCPGLAGKVQPGEVTPSRVSGLVISVSGIQFVEKPAELEALAFWGLESYSPSLAALVPVHAPVLRSAFSALPGVDLILPSGGDAEVIPPVMQAVAVTMVDCLPWPGTDDQPVHIQVELTVPGMNVGELFCVKRSPGETGNEKLVSVVDQSMLTVRKQNVQHVTSVMCCHEEV